MARIPYSPVPDVAPDGAPRNDYQNISGADAEAFGGGAARGRAAIGQGLEQLGRGIQSAANDALDYAKFYNGVSADNASNDYQAFVNQTLRGDPGRTVPGPDGQPIPDAGFLGLQGRQAIDRWQQVQETLEEKRKEIGEQLSDGEQRRQYENQSLGYTQSALNTISGHASTQYNSWYSEVEKASEGLALDHIANNADNAEEVAHGAADLIDARVKAAQRLGAQPGDQLWTAAVDGGKQAALEAQTKAIAIRDPARALRILDNNRPIAGARYDELANSFRARADAQIGVEAGDKAYAQAGQAKAQTILGAADAGETAKAVLRSREGFIPQAKWDVNHYRVGYGSDTITKPDGTVVPVTKDTVVTQEDAERDLARRTADTQAKVQTQIGAEQWAAMTPQAQAALVSVAYNYGTLPNRVVVAARTGDQQAISEAVYNLKDDNNGVNADRRRFESELISGLKGDAYRAVLSDPGLTVEQQQHAIERVRQLDTNAQIAANNTATARREANESAANGYVTRMLKGDIPTVAEIADNPALSYDTKNSLADMALRKSGSDAQGASQAYGPGFWKAFQSIILPTGAPGRISQMQDLYSRAGPGGDLTLDGVNKLGQIMQETRKSVDGNGLNQTLAGAIANAKKQLSFEEQFPTGGGIRDPEGEAVFNTTFQTRFWSAYNSWTGAGNDPYKFPLFDPKNMDKLTQELRPRSQMNAARIAALGDSTGDQAAPPPPQGVPQEGWTSAMSVKPSLDKSGTPYPADQWAKVIETLRANPTPDVIKAFNDRFGRHIGMSAEDILKQLGQ